MPASAKRVLPRPASLRRSIAVMATEVPKRKSASACPKVHHWGQSSHGNIYGYIKGLDGVGAAVIFAWLRWAWRLQTAI
jgi:hypothetical protein